MADDVTSGGVRDVAVIGAGMVGVSTALALQRQGLAPVLIDRREPGRETSYGNAGVLSSGSVIPLNGPSLWSSLPSYLTNQNPALRWRAGWPVSNLAWSLRFLANARETATEPRSAALHALLGTSIKLHRAWMVSAGVSHRLRETGWLKVWRSDGRATAEREYKTLASFGIASEIVDRQAISALEPAMRPLFQTGLLHKDTLSVDAPGAVVTAYADLFAKGGGTILRAEVTSLSRTGNAWRVVTRTGAIAARHVVITLGPWSADVLGGLGYRVPMAFERGYHQEFRATGAHTIGRPLHDCEKGYVMTPVENGVRLTSGVELAARDAASSLVQIEAAAREARSVIDLGVAVREVWRGARPTLPDCLPMIGPATQHQDLWLAFGHQHIGFTTGPATGAIIAAMIGGMAPPIDAKAFSPARYL